VYTHKSFKWSLQTYYSVLKKESYGFTDIMIKRYNWGSHDDMWIEFRFTIPLLNTVATCCKYAENRLAQMHATVQMALGDICWTRSYEKNERKFSSEILLPLFRKMGFHNISFKHGRKEFGKDFTFSEIDKFNQVQHYGVQVKAGNISGEVNSVIDEIISQIKDAFRIPYYDINNNNPHYISTCLIICSGSFTENAKDKIMHKVDKGLHGSIYFLDKKATLEMIEKYCSI
jgi:hypothetical protein